MFHVFLTFPRKNSRWSQWIVLFCRREEVFGLQIFGYQRILQKVDQEKIDMSRIFGTVRQSYSHKRFKLSCHDSWPGIKDGTFRNWLKRIGTLKAIKCKYSDKRGPISPEIAAYNAVQEDHGSDPEQPPCTSSSAKKEEKSPVPPKIQKRRQSERLKGVEAGNERSPKLIRKHAP